MRVLMIKTSSMGDVIHTLPALTDAGLYFSNIQFDWVVEENFAEIPRWHPLVNQVIPIAQRRWRKNLFTKKTYSEFKDFLNFVRQNSYDFVIDAQGLLKSVWLTLFAKGKRCGLNWESAREPLASIFYTHKYAAGKIKEVHAVTRTRNLLSAVLGYEKPATVANYGIDRQQFITGSSEPYVVFLHGTTWDTKHWPEHYWQELIKKVTKKNISVKLLWGNEIEKARANRLAQDSPKVVVMPKMKLAEVAGVLASAQAIVSVDTGLGHLAAALDVPTISLYGPTDPALTGTVGESQIHLQTTFKCSPCLSASCHYPSPLNPAKPACFSTLSPEVVWNTLSTLL